MKSIIAGRVFGLAAIVALSACASTQALTQGEVGRSGARTFNEPKATTFAICVGALTAEGYEIAHSDLKSGVIETKPMAARGEGPATARAYRVTVTADGQGSRVVAQPILFAGGRDISNADSWVLDGPEGERAQWADLFAVMNAALVTPAAVAPAQNGNDRQAVANNATGAGPVVPLAKQPATPSSDGAARPGGLTPAGLSAPQGSSARP